ncbi:MAG: hypothetical protein Q4G07_08260 [Oscillospiraceae bacterium]|nr:hypothetical protein [Oscillospiraceae bacterium]
MRCKRICSIVFAALFLCCMIPFCGGQQVYAAETGQPDELLDETLIPDEAKEFLEEQPYTIEELQQMTFPDLLQKLWGDFCSSLKEPVLLFAKLCGILLLSALLHHFKKDGAQGLSTALDTSVTVTAFLLVSQPLLGLFADIGGTLETARSFMAMFVPVFSTVMVACGQPATSVLYSGMFLSGITLIAQILTGGILPFIKIYLALTITKGVGGGLKLGAFTDFISKAVKWALGLLATVFAAVLSFQTYLAGGADSIALRTGKFLIGSGIPVIGHAVSDAMGTVFAGLKMVKGAVGIMGIAGILLVFLPVLVSCLGYYTATLAARTVASALGNDKGEGLLSGFCECLSLYMVVLIFFMTLTVLGQWWP